MLYGYSVRKIEFTVILVLHNVLLSLMHVLNVSTYVVSWSIWV